MASVATVVTHGFGSFSSANLLPTLGYGIGGGVTAVGPGPLTSFVDRTSLDSNVTRLEMLAISGRAELIGEVKA